MNFARCLSIPEDLVKELPSLGQVSKYHVSLEVQAIKLSAEEKEKHPRLFKGRAPDISQTGLDSFERPHNMSGEPIFGFSYNAKGELRYWIVALQSTWSRSTNVITGCFVLFLADYLDYFVSKVREHQEQTVSKQ